MARLQHPNIVRVYEVGEQAGSAYLALEFVDGGSLADKLAGVPVRPRDAAALGETLARTVHQAHQHGILHCHLKPANVLLARSDGAQAVRLGGSSEESQRFEGLGAPGDN